MASLELEDPPRTASVLVVEDHMLLAEGLSAALQQEGMHAATVIGPDTDAILDAARQMRPDVVLLDLMLGDAGVSIPLIEPLRTTGAAVLMLTGVTDTALLGACIEAGACGLVSKRESFASVVDKVMRAVHRRMVLLESEREEMLGTLRRRREQDRDRLEPFERLTARERIVLGALMDGASADEIAVASFVSLATVRSQIRSILVKLGVRSQVAAVALAYHSHWESA